MARSVAEPARGWLAIIPWRMRCRTIDGEAVRKEETMATDEAKRAHTDRMIAEAIRGRQQREQGPSPALTAEIQRIEATMEGLKREARALGLRVPSRYNVL